MRALRAEITSLAAAGMRRKRIALELHVTPAQVTRYLGAARRWKDRRVPRGSDSQKLPLAPSAD